MVALFIIFAFIMLFIPLVRFCIWNFYKIIYYGIKDIIKYFKTHKWKIYDMYGIFIYGGLYGGGKTLSIVQYCENVYKNFDNVKFISNITLKNIPYEKFEYFEQLMEEPDYEGQCIVYVIDEIGSLMNSRNYKNNRIGETQFLYTLNQIRKQGKTLLLASQRFGMCDKNFRQCAVQWIECSRTWRIHKQLIYDPYDLECTLNPRLVEPIESPKYFFATDKMYNAYNTVELVKDFKDKFNADNFNPIIVEPLDNSLEGNIQDINKLTHKGKKRLRWKK